MHRLRKRQNPKRQAELKEAGDRAEKICWDTPDSFAEALHAVWLNTMLLNVEASGPCINVGRLDQLLWPYLLADLESGKESVDSALEWMEEYNIKCCNIPWLLPEGLAHCFGGYYRWLVVTVWVVMMRMEMMPLICFPTFV